MRYNEYSISKYPKTRFHQYQENDNKKYHNPTISMEQQFKLINECSRSKSKLKIISFIGNIKQNIHQLFVDIECKCKSKPQYQQILYAFAQKIEKIRQQRNKYRDRFKQLKGQYDYLVLQKKQYQKSFKTYKQKFEKIEKDILLPYQNFLKEKHDLLQEVQQLKLKKNDDLKQMMSIEIKQKEQILKHLKNRQQQLKQITENYQFSILQINSHQQTIDVMKQRIKDLENQKMELLTFISKIQKQKKKQNLKNEQQTTRVRQECKKQEQNKKDYIPNNFNQEESQLWKLACQLGQQAWKKHLQIEIRRLYEKKENLRQLQRKLSEKKCKCNI